MQHRRRTLLTSLALAVTLSVASIVCAGQVVAQPACRFVLGFAELAALLGPEVVGSCIEDQRTITGAETIPLPKGVGDPTRQATSVTLDPGTAVQRTSKGLFTWSPSANLTEFETADGVWILSNGTALYYRWLESTPSAPPTPARTATARAIDEAEAECFGAYSAPTLESLGKPEAEQRRLKAEADAILYLCSKAIEEDGPRGMTCFSQAWEAARGMERVFPGSGMRTYEEKYRACLAGR